MEKYTTTAIKEAIIADKDATLEEKASEQKKVVLSDDAFAICDFIEQLNRRIEDLRKSFITSI